MKNHSKHGKRVIRQRKEREKTHRPRQKNNFTKKKNKKRQNSNMTEKRERENIRTKVEN